LTGLSEGYETTEPIEAESVENMPGCLKMGLEKFRKEFRQITVCWYGAYERVMDLPNTIPEKGYTIKTKKTCSDNNDVVVSVYEDFGNYFKRRNLPNCHWKKRQRKMLKLNVPVKFESGSQTYLSYELVCNLYRCRRTTLCMPPLDRRGKSSEKQDADPTQSWVIEPQTGEVMVTKSDGKRAKEMRKLDPAAIAIYAKKGLKLKIEEGDIDWTVVVSD